MALYQKAMLVTILVLTAAAECSASSQEPLKDDARAVNEPPAKRTHTWTWTLFIPMFISGLIAPLVYKLFMWKFGFRSTGIVRHSAAAMIMRHAPHGAINSKSFFASLQSTAHHGTNEMEVVSSILTGMTSYFTLFVFFYYPVPVLGLVLLLAGSAYDRAHRTKQLRTIHHYHVSSPTVAISMRWTGIGTFGAWVAFQAGKCLFYALQAYTVIATSRPSE